MNDFTYFHRVDGDTWEGTHDEYLQNDALVELVRNPDLIHFYCGLTIMTFTPDWLMGQPKVQEQLRLLEQEQRTNPLRFYAPNSQAQLDFINDEEGTVCAIVDPNRCGKTTSAWVKMLVGPHPMLKADPSWEIFTDHGVNYHAFQKPISTGVATYNTAKLEDPIWASMIKQWTPDEELHKYRRHDRKRGCRFGPNWGHDKHILMEKSRSQIGFYTYEQDQGNYEGGALKKWLWDEQGKEAMWNGADRGTRTTNGVHYFALTPHQVEGRPDTGAGGWLYPFLTGQKTYGHTVRVFTGTSINDVPDWIYPQSQKDIEYEKWEHEPVRIQREQGISQRKIIAEGRARLYGEWHVTADIVLDEWQPEISWIEPLWDEVPPDVTIFRGLDHGIRNPTTCCWLAVDKEQNIYVYRSMYSKGQSIGENVRKVIEMSGNERRKIGQTEQQGTIVQQYEEVYRKEHVAAQVMDSRSFALPSTLVGKPHGWLYKQAGLQAIKQASGKFTSHWVPRLQELLRVDMDRTHPNTGKPGASRLMIFNTPENMPLKYELEHYFWKKQKEGAEPKEEVEKKNDHLINALAYAIQIPPRYLGNMGGSHDEYTEGHYEQQEHVAPSQDEEYRTIG